MFSEKTAAIALIAGALASVLIMAQHPAGAHDLHDPKSGAAHLNLVVHTLGIAALAVIFAGTLAIPSRSGDTSGLAILGVVAYGLAALCGTLAATASGYLVPSLLERLASAAGDHSALQASVAFAHDFNQSFAKLFTGATASAFLIWSAAIFQGRAMPRALAWSAFAVGSVVVAKAVWFFALGLIMLRPRRGPGI